MNNFELDVICNTWAERFFSMVDEKGYPNDDVVVEMNDTSGRIAKIDRSGSCLFITRLDEPMVAFARLNNRRSENETALAWALKEVFDPLSPQNFEKLFCSFENIKKQSGRFKTIEDHVMSGCVFGLCSKDNGMKLHTRSLAIALYLFGFQAEDIVTMCREAEKVNVAHDDLYDYVTKRFYFLYNYISEQQQ